MPYIALNSFSGISPRTGPTELDPNQAQIARNVKLLSGEIRPWKKPSLVYTPAQSDVRAIYLLENTSLGLSKWLEWVTDVDVVPGPVSDLSDFRIYYTGDGAPKKTNWNLATSTGAGTKPFPNAYQMLGVPSPVSPPTLAATTGTGETRVYVYTYVNTFGAVTEESAPSPAATISIATTTTAVTVSGFANAPAASANYNITELRIYRSVSGTYQYVASVSVNPTTGVPTSSSYVDSTLAANLGVTLPSLYYTPPPSDLKGMVAMPNGILAGFRNNQVWFCEPYLPHAWPSSYMMTVGSPIVGLGVFGQSLVVCTNSSPYIITGTQPGAMSQEKVPLPEPCVSKRSIVGDQYGVLYASPNGVVSIAPGSQDVVTRSIMTRDEWQTYIPSTIIGALYQNMYVMFFQVGQTKSSLVMTRGDTPPLVQVDIDSQGAFLSRTNATLYSVSATDGKVYQIDADPVNNLFYEWKSKKFVLPEPANFAAMKMQADWNYIADATAYNTVLAQIIAANQLLWSSGASLKSTPNSTQVNTLAVNASILQNQPTAADVRNVQVIVNGDDAQVYSAGITSQEPVRMPATDRRYIYEIKLTGNAPIRQFRMATSVGELRQV
jgi:hypothetical protein